MLTGRFASITLLALTLVLGLYGIERSLWLDEAWVANSVNAPSLREMFYYPNWLQTTPPLFLLFARAVISVFGLSTVVLRCVPLVLSLLAVAAMLAAARRILSPSFAVLATAALAFHPTVVEYFRSFKHYGGEVASTGLVLWAAIAYLQSPARQRFYLLLTIVTAAMTLAYSTVFLLPGIILAVAVTSRGRAIALTAATGTVLGLLYWFLIRPNYSPALREYWRSDPQTLLTPGIIAAVLFCIFAGARAVSRPRNWIAILLLSPCVLLFLSELLSWYPASPRTQLFVRPCFLLLLSINIEELVKFAKWPPTPVNAVAILAAAAVMLLGVRKQFHDGRFQPEENLSGAVRYLRKNVTTSDLVLVHPSLREGFLLYTAMQGWIARPVIYGDTGWPCCPRGRPAGVDLSTPEKIRRDLDAKIPSDFHGRIWLFYTDRPLHWKYVGAEDPKLWQNYFWGRNCRAELYIRFANLGLTPMKCGGNSP